MKRRRHSLSARGLTHSNTPALPRVRIFDGTQTNAARKYDRNERSISYSFTSCCRSFRGTYGRHLAAELSPAGTTFFSTSGTDTAFLAGLGLALDGMTPRFRSSASSDDEMHASSAFTPLQKRDTPDRQMGSFIIIILIGQSQGSMQNVKMLSCLQ